ncbi:MAG TPA: chemotaxis protein CheA [Polyangiaceae bacterium]|nr:chemotaxis protein CheA [Polyangiaceae bacterium]
MTKSLSDIQRELLGTFFEESIEGLQQLESGLLSLEGAKGPQADTINDVFRAAHSIKGGAGSFGLGEVASVAHAMESLLEDFRAERARPSRESLALLLEGVDWLRKALDARRAGNTLPSAECDTLRLRLEALRTHLAPAPVAVEATPAAVVQSLRVLFRPLPRLLESGNEPVRLLRELCKLGEANVTVDTSRLPSLADMDPSLCYLSWDISLAGSDLSQAAIQEVFSWVDTDAEVRIEEPARAELAAVAPAAKQTEQYTGSPALEPERPQPTPLHDARPETIGSIRVGVDKIDLLMNMVGELVITQSMLGVLDHETEIDARRIEQLREGLGLLARNTRSLQESVMRLRSVPISVVFSRFPRLVHDLGQQLGKQVELKVSGETTEIDKTVVEKLGDPLVHLVRNSLDHGLESPEARRLAGKSEVGRIELSAYHHGGDVVVEVRDDGKGINRERIIERARSLGQLGADEVPSDEAIRDFIFAPGFSTAAAVTDVSGRGVGMDVVRRNIRALGGDVFIETAVGKGTRISMRLPLTLAIIDGQLIRVGDHSYVVPLLSIIESVQVEPKRLTRFEGKRELYRLRDQLIPTIELGRVLGQNKQQRSEDSLMVIVETEGDHIGLLVDELLAQQQVVVKSLETNYERVEGLSGATILGDGSVAFILDTAAIGRMVRGSNNASAHAA